MQPLTEEEASDVFEWYDSLEHRLQEIAHYLPLNKQENQEAVSPRFVPVLIEAASIIDSIFRRTLPDKVPRPKGREVKRSDANVNDYYQELEPKLQLSGTSSLVLVSPPFVVTPFQGWTEKVSPTWWKAYNSLKHDRLRNSKQANLKNTLNAVCALQQLIVAGPDTRKLLIRSGWVETGSWNPVVLQEALSSSIRSIHPAMISYSRLFATPVNPTLWPDLNAVVPIYFDNSRRLTCLLGRDVPIRA